MQESGTLFNLGTNTGMGDLVLVLCVNPGESWTSVLLILYGVLNTVFVTFELVLSSEFSYDITGVLDLEKQTKDGI